MKEREKVFDKVLVSVGRKPNSEIAGLDRTQVRVGERGFIQVNKHLQTGDPAKDRTALFAALLADAINLGLTKMAEACAGMTFNRLAWVVDWHVRDETYTKALAEIIYYHHRIPFAAYWGDGTTSSSDGQRFKAGGRSEATAQVNLRYGTEPGVTFYTHNRRQVKEREREDQNRQEEG